MKLPPYPKYKPSGEAWVPELPDSWDLVRLRWLSQRYAGGTPDKSNSAFWDDGDIPWLNSGAVNDGYITQPSEYIALEGFVGSSAKWIPKGALVMALAGQGKTKGMVAQLGFPATCNQSMAAIIPTRRIRSRYLYWWLTANYFNIRNMAGGEARDGLNLDLLGSIPCPVPEDDAQCAIADFLDRETATIDKLVAKKRTLVERLKEKRTALISCTVTRGLPPEAARAAGFDPHPRLERSGIDWLGDVPQHWEVGKFSREVRIAEGQVDPEIEPYSSMLLIAPNHIESGTGRLIATETAAYQGAISGKYLCSAGDAIYSKIRPALAKAVLAPEDCLCSADMYPMKSTGRLRSRYMLLVLLSSQFTAWSVLGADRVAMPKVNRETLNDLRLPVPTLNEQDAIAGFLDRETVKIDGMIAKVEAAIERLQEYRTALITAAVTGKIDVRNEHG